MQLSAEARTIGIPIQWKDRSMAELEDASAHFLQVVAWLLQEERHIPSLWEEYHLRTALGAIRRRDFAAAEKSLREAIRTPAPAEISHISLSPPRMTTEEIRTAFERLISHWPVRQP